MQIADPYIVLYSQSDANWRVYRADASQATSVHSTKQEAIQSAKKAAGPHGGTPACGVVVTDTNGDFQRFIANNDYLDQVMHFSYDENSFPVVNRHFMKHR